MLCVLGVALLHFMTRRVYLRVVRDQAMAAQPAPSVQLQPLPRWPPDLEAPSTPVQPTAAPRLAVLVLQPDSKVHIERPYCLVEMDNIVREAEIYSVCSSWPLPCKPACSPFLRIVVEYLTFVRCWMTV